MERLEALKGTESSGSQKELGPTSLLLASLQAGCRISEDYVLVHLGSVKEKVVYHLPKEKIIDDTC